MRRAQRRGGSWRSRSLLGVLAIFTLLVTGCQAYVLDSDVVQQRFDVATPSLDGTHTVGQTFTCQRPNLCQIELLPAVYGTPGRGTLTWQLTAAEGDRKLVEQSIDVATIRSNVPLRLSFPVQSDSTGQSYELLLEGTPQVDVGFWHSSFNAYGGGELQMDGTSHPGKDLHFATYCRYDLPAMLRQIRGSFLPRIWLFIPLAVLLLLPGYVLGHNLGLKRQSDPVAILGVMIALSLAVVPIALLWSTVLGLRWQRTVCQAAVVLLGLYALAHLLRTRGRDLAPWIAKSQRRLLLTMCVLMVSTLLLRFVQIRDLVLPAWVDSPQHVLISQLVALHGQVPQSYEPLLPVTAFAYHFGFHADTVLFSWLSGLPIPQAMLVLGLALNAACALAAYLLTSRLTERKMAGIVAATIVGMVSYMPAYYVSWGRYTQLTGLVLLPAAVVITVQWLEAAKRDYRCLLTAALLQAGLFLTHARVSIFAASFLLAYLLVEGATHLRARDRSAHWELWQRTGLLALLALGLSAPWLAQITPTLAAYLRAVRSGLHRDPIYSAVPQGLLFITRNRELMIAAAIGAIAGLLRRRRETALILLWCGVVALVVNPGWAGLPAITLINSATAVIALFLPLAVLVGQAVTLVWDSVPLALDALATRLGLAWQPARAARGALALVMVSIALCSAWGMVSIINPGTVLATADDLVAMTWIRENTPPDALFLINTRYWQLGIYTGTDGGYWIPQIAGRRTLLPAIPYAYGFPDDVQHITDMARIVSQTEDAQDSRFRAILENEGVTHIYIGAKGGPLTPGMFLGDPRYRFAYSSGAVWIFEVVV